MENKASLLKSASVCAELDCLLSLAICAYEGNYCRPKVTESDEIFIEQGFFQLLIACIRKPGRHPLTEMIVDAFIPNDTHMNEDQGRIQVITGKCFFDGVEKKYFKVRMLQGRAVI